MRRFSEYCRDKEPLEICCGWMKNCLKHMIKEIAPLHQTDGKKLCAQALSEVCVCVCVCVCVSAGVRMCLHG